MKKRTLLFTTLLTLSFICGTIAYAQQHPSYRYDIEKDNYYVWSTWTEFQKDMFLLGYIQGAYAMACEVAFASGYPDLLNMVNDKLPTYKVKEYRVSVDWIYDMAEVRKVPVFAIIIRLDEFLELRRDRYQKEGR